MVYNSEPAPSNNSWCNKFKFRSDDEFLAHFEEDGKTMHIDHIWHQIPKQIDLYFGQPRFKHLAELLNFYF